MRVGSCFLVLTIHLTFFATDDLANSLISVDYEAMLTSSSVVSLISHCFIPHLKEW